MKYGIEFADAVGILDDPHAITIEDPDAESEQRVVTIGLDLLGRVVVVGYAYRSDNIRLISARKANIKRGKKYARIILSRCYERLDFLPGSPFLFLYHSSTSSFISG